MRKRRNIAVMSVMNPTEMTKIMKANENTTKDTIEAETKMEKKDTTGTETEMKDIKETEMMKDIMETETEIENTIKMEMMNITEEDVI